MKRFVLLASASVLFASSAAFADWYTVNGTQMQLRTDSSDPQGIRVLVTGIFTPALPCAVQAFVIGPNDPLFKETYAMILAAQFAGTPIRYEHIYCTTEGVGRGNKYITGAN